MSEEKRLLAKMYWIHALTPLHVGVGEGVGFIDLPIVREKATMWPLLPGSAIKGVLADDGGDAEARKKDPVRRAAFGIAESSEDGYGSHTGSLVFSDARLVCLPVRSLYGTFAWVTSALALKRLKRDLDAASEGVAVPDLSCEADAIAVTKTSVLGSPSGKKSYLSDLDFSLAPSESVDIWALELGKRLFGDSEEEWRSEFSRRFAVVSGDIFDFFTETATEVNARVRIDPAKKTVIDGALWYEEALPAESILAGLVWCSRDHSGKNFARQNILERFCAGTKLLQMGGKATVGRGQVRCVFGGTHA